MAWRASRTQVGQSESVSRGQPSGGFTFCHDFSRGLSDQAGVKLGLGLIWFNRSNTAHAAPAARVNPFSTYLIGLCMHSPRATTPPRCGWSRDDIRGIMRDFSMLCEHFAAVGQILGAMMHRTP